jgi:hypothetical protein
MPVSDTALWLLLEWYYVRYAWGEAPPFNFQAVLNSREHSPLIATCFAGMKAQQQFCSTFGTGMLR